METFELWSYDVSGDLGQYAEHTYVKCPDNNEYFDCWGNHESPTQGSGVHRFSCEGIYEVANCYRHNIFTVRDTAGIGIYGINGVCHQTANLFLYSSNRAISIEDGVKGYWLSSLAYGTYGDVNPFDSPAQPLFIEVWKQMVYNPCYQEYRGGKGLGGELFKLIAELHRTFVKGEMAISHNELIHHEASILAKQVLPDINTDGFKDIHMDFLNDKTSSIKEGLKGDQLAKKINEIAVQFQKDLMKRIGDEAYKKLTGLEAGETINIVDSVIAAKAAQQ